MLDSLQAVNDSINKQMENAEKDYRRFEQLLAKDAVTRQQYDNAKAHYEAAHARYEAARNRQQATTQVLGEQQQRLGQSAAGESVAEAQVNLARLNLSYTVILATCDGVMGCKDINVGQLVQPGQQLARIVDDHQVWVVANYRETQMKHIAVGNKERGMARFASLEEAKRNLEAWRQSSLEFLRLKIDH